METDSRGTAIGEPQYYSTASMNPRYAFSITLSAKGCLAMGTETAPCVADEHRSCSRYCSSVLFCLRAFGVKLIPQCTFSVCRQVFRSRGCAELCTDHVTSIDIHLFVTHAGGRGPGGGGRGRDGGPGGRGGPGRYAPSSTICLLYQKNISP